MVKPTSAIEVHEKQLKNFMERTWIAISCPSGGVICLTSGS